MAETLRFEKPHAGLRDSYREMVREFVERGERLIPFPLSFPLDDFDACLAKLAACERGEGLPSGFVPHSTYWLVRNGKVVVAVSNLRHRLTDGLRVEAATSATACARRSVARVTEILRHTLLEAKALGLAEALLTCARGNTASVRTILRCGGGLRSEAYLPERGEIVQRYVIALGGSPR
jgi:predicted acetyltransferase